MIIVILGDSDSDSSSRGVSNFDAEDYEDSESEDEGSIMIEPERHMVSLIWSLWDDLITPLWITRNDILHHNTNFVSDTTYAQLGGDRLLWYIQHKSSLAQQDQYLTQFSAAQVDAMGYGDSPFTSKGNGSNIWILLEMRGLKNSQ